MTPERKAKIKELREKLANLSPEMKQALIQRGIVATVEGRPLSLHNTLLVHFQSQRIPTVVGGYQQWKQAGKQVRRGEHGMIIWFPVGEKDKETGDITSAERFFVTTVFDISQVEERRLENGNLNNCSASAD